MKPLFTFNQIILSSSSFEKIIENKHFLTFLLSLLFLGGVFEASAQVTNDYRSKTSGNWNVASSWESYNGTAWVTATSVPSSTANVITIQSGHTIIVSTAVTADQLTIGSGGQITINSSLTIADGADAFDIIVNGTLLRSGTLSLQGSAAMQVGNGGTYTHALDGSSIPIATWDANSTVNITGTIGNNIVPTSTAQTFGNVIYNCPSLTVSQTFSSASVTGNFTITSTGAANPKEANANKLILGSDITIASGKSFTVNGVSTLILGNNVISGAGSFNLLGNATLGIGNSGGINSNVTTTKTLSSTGNYIFNGNNTQPTLGLPSTVNNLVFTSTSGGTTTRVKTFSQATTITSGLSITSPVQANLGTFTHTAGSLTLDNLGATGGSWGGTGSGTTNINPIYFATASGKINGIISTCTAGSLTANVAGGSPTCAGANAIFSITGTPNTIVTYTLNNGTNTDVTLNNIGTGTVTINGATTTQVLNLVSAKNAITNCLNTISGTSTATVYQTPVITGQPGNQLITYGANTTFTVTATNDHPTTATFQWQEQIGGGAWTTISNGGIYSGATTAILTLTKPVVSVSTRNYRCVITNPCGSATSNGLASLTVNPKALAITANNRSKCEGTNATFLGTEFTQVGLVSGDNIAGVTLTSAGVLSTATKSSPGPTYPIIVSAATGSGLSNYTITYNSGTLTITSPTLSFVPTPASCFGNLGSAVLQATDGSGSGYVFTSNITTNVAIIGNLITAPSGVYVITVTDGAGCTKSSTLTITQPLVISGNGAKKSYNGSDLSCATTADGEITVTATGGTGTKTYAIDNGTYQTSNAFTGLAAGTHSLKVKDANNCEVNLASVIITAPSAVVAGNPSSSQTNVSCFGGNNGAINLTVTAASGGSGTKTYSYVWSKTGGEFTATTKDISDLLAGIYSVVITATDANGCTGSTSLTGIAINQPPILSAIVTPTNAPCFGSIGSIVVTSPSGGAGTYEYSKDNGATWQATGTFPSLLAGTYQISIRDAAVPTCIIDLDGSSGTVIGQPTSLPSASISGTTGVCVGSDAPAITFTGTGGTGTLTYTYKINAGSDLTTTSSTITAPTTTVGTSTYTLLSVTDANNCVVNYTTGNVATITVNALPTVTTTNVAICAGASTTLTASGASTYGWTEGTTVLTNLTVSPTATTTYSVEGTDANGCKNTASLVVTVNLLPILTVVNPAAVCNSATVDITTATVQTTNNGTTTKYYSTNALAMADGTEDVTTPTAIASSSTVYIRSQSSVGCYVVQPVTVTINPLPTFTTTLINPSCNAGTNGSITVTTSAINPMFSKDGGTTYVAGTSPYTFSTLAGGAYFIRVKDVNSCASGSTNVTLTQPAAIVVIATPTATLCFGDNGSAALSAMGGNGTYTFTSSGGTVTGSSLLALAGTYLITATDGNGCTGTFSVTIGQPTAALSAITSKVDVLCFGGATGSASVVVSGGTSGYTYAWSPSGGSAATATGLIAGTYTVLITDANGCTLSKNITIGQPTSATTITASSNTPICETSALNLTSTPTSSTGNLAFAWAGPNSFTASTQNASIATTTLLTAGIYTVTVTDGNSCVASAVTTVVINPLPSAYTITGTGQICNGIASPITLNGSQTGINYTLKTTSFTYNGSVISGTGSALTFIPPSTPTGVYTIEATNTATGCTRIMTGSITTTISTNPTITISSQTNVSCFGGNDASITVIASSGTGSYNYAFNGEASQATGVFTDKSVGNFPITATDANTGCIGTINVIFTQPASLPSATVVVSGIACVGNTVILTATATGGTAGYMHNWNGTGFVASNTLTVTTAGINTLVIKDSKGCISTAAVSTNVTFNALPIPIIVGTTTVCSGVNLELTANDGVTYAWSGPNSFTSTTSIISIPNAQVVNTGVYSVIVTNANSCVASAITTITVNPTPTTSTTPLSAVLTCTNQSTTLTASGGDTYLWTGTGGFTASTAIANVTAAGTYTIMASSSAGCTSTASITVTENKAIPTVGVTLTATVLTCASPNTTITSTGADAYLWTKAGGGFTATTANATIITAGIYTVIGTSTANGCTASATIEITENKIIPIITVTPTTAILTCANPSTTITVSDASTYAWSGTGGFTASTATASITAGGTYTVVGTSTANGCTASASIIITENKVLPTVSITGSATICTGETLNLTAAGGGTYAWLGPNAFNATTAAISLPFAVVAYAGTYTVTVTNTNGCTANATSLVTVNAVPITPTVQANVNIPAGTSTILTATGCAGTLLWFKTSDNSLVTMPITPTVTTTYYAKCSVTTNSVTCIGQASENVTVTVEPLPLVVISVKTGNWEDPTTWNVGRLPYVSENAMIDISHIITITDNTATAKKIIYKSGATLKFGNTTAKLTLGSL